MTRTTQPQTNVWNDWQFEVPDADIDFLAAGETLVQTYDVTADDGNGGTTTQTVEVTLTGTNDAPEITGGKIVADFIEIIDGGPGENINQLDDTGIIDFSDADLTDAHTVSTTYPPVRMPAPIAV